MSGGFAVAERRGPEPGPTVALLAGIHGDEEEGVLAVQRVLAAVDAQGLRAGALRAVPVAHPEAYDADQRVSPLDGKDLARCFPGDPEGSATSRLADALTRTVIADADLLVDLHSAGRHYAMPLFCGFTARPDSVGDRARSAAMAFAAPLIWAHPAPPPPGRTLSVAFDRGIPAVYVEGAGGARLRAADVDVYVAGVLDILVDAGVLFEAPPSPQRRVVATIENGSGDLDSALAAEVAGRFVSRVRAGSSCAVGALLGEVVDDAGVAVQSVRAADDGLVAYLRRTARVGVGDPLVKLAPRPRPL
jgi:predicted deacylase